jgi:hypothetical protein
MSLELLIFCLDAGDLRGFRLHSAAHRFPALAQALTYAADLPSTIIPQTPVAWSALLCGGGPETTGVWGWHGVNSVGEVQLLSRGILPSGWQEWGNIPVLLAGMPLLEETKGPWGKSLEGLAGPGRLTGGSRAALNGWRSASEAYAQWERHHERWAERVVGAASEARIALVHCDSVDWFSHRFGPSSEEGALGWKLADKLLGRLMESLRPRATVIISDHGSTEVKRVLRIHEALYRRGLSSRPPESLQTATDVLKERVFCISDYGALWCRDESATSDAEHLLFELGARSVHRVKARPESQAPTLVPEFEDGCLVLVPPALYKDFGAGDEVAASDFAESLKKYNWTGDHARLGLVGADCPGVWSNIHQASLTDLKSRIVNLMMS